MLTTATRELYLLQSASSVRRAEALQAKSTAAISSSSLVFVDPDQPAVHMIDPLKALNCAKYQARSKTELHFAGKGLNAIHPHTQLFVNVETIVLSDNKLSKVEGLLPKGSDGVTDAPTGCTRLKRLLLSHNCITTLKGDIQELKYLEVLLLGNNYLSNMETVSRQLRHLGYLKQLDLFGNPVSEEQSYRLYFIHHHPSLELLDRKSVTQEERSEAAALFGKRRDKDGSGHNSSRRSSATSLATSPTGKAAPQPSASLAPKKEFVFGSSYTLPQDAGTTLRRNADGLSASAALLEAKVRQILLKRSADELREVSRAQAELDEIADQRKAFHAVWEWSRFLCGSKSADVEGGVPMSSPSAPATTKGGKGSAAAPAQQPVAAAAPATLPKASGVQLPAVLPKPTVITRDPRQSSLFGPDAMSKYPKIQRLLQLAHDIETAESAERRNALGEQLQAELHHMIPDRLGDSYNDALAAAKEARFPAMCAQYLQRMVQTLLTAQELASFQKMFSSDVPSVDIHSWEAIADVINDGDTDAKKLSAAQLKSAFAAEFPATPSVGVGRKSIVAKATSTCISTDQALQLLVCFVPFAEGRPSFFQKLAAQAVTSGDSDAAKTFLQRYNDAVEHVKTLSKQPPQGSKSTAFVRLVKL